jgi:hypothetical protein
VRSSKSTDLFERGTVTNKLLLPLLALVMGAGFGDSLASSQSAQIRDLMKVKLEHSQQILAAVATSDWINLERHSAALLLVVQNPAWTTLTTPEYVRYSAAFLGATQDLVEAAKQRDLETASMAYVSLTLSCVQCHRHVGRARLAGTSGTLP